MTTPTSPTSQDLWRRWGNRLRAERERRGWTQVELAKRSGQSQGTISAIERGVAGGSDTARYALEQALEVPGVFSFAEISVPGEVAS